MLNLEQAKELPVLRQARVTDVPAMHALIGGFADEGKMLPRPRARLYEMVRDFVVAEEDDAVVAAGAVVNADVGDFEIVGGVPAKVIDSRR